MADLTVKQIVGLMDKADRNIGHDIRAAGFNKFPIRVKIRIRISTQLANEQGLPRTLFPNPEIADPQKIVVVLQQLLQTRSRNVDQLDLHLFRGSGYLSPFDDILFSRSGRLYHLVYGPVTSGKKSLTKSKRQTVNDLGLPE